MSTLKFAALAALLLMIGGCASTSGERQLAQTGDYANAAHNDTTSGAKDSVTTSGLPD